ncbi:MAG: CDP-alcohol phosphatidyltransferase family protein [Desulfatiglans sp.]|jgi:cardiolipin synthase|nr:CDP-alcohol phosphatidyltransferase family protein [Thermodesulfobacteriota bacterium]MEE4353659.1 CDP-alcohol phosphatidyltransferase family protein [Desulfatiglans sp.]
MTLANLITSIRIILAPIFIIYLINDEFIAALIVFIVAGVSDGLDGFIARVFDQKSKIGSYLDPLADKILLIAAFVVLSVREFVPPWLGVTVICRDMLILLGVLILFLNGSNFVIKPSFVSKVTTCLQLVTVFVVLLKSHLNFVGKIDSYLFWLTGILTITSGLHYMRYWFRTMAEDALSN